MQTHADKNHATPASADHKRQRGDESTALFANNRAEAITQRQLQGTANDSPQTRRLQAAQDMANASHQGQQALIPESRHKSFGGLSGKTAQLKSGPEEEELLQGRFQALQRQGPEEEELLQGKFEPVQRMGPEEEEEPLQGKFQTLQRQDAEEEELLQGKFEPVQRMGPEEEEEPLQGKFQTLQRQGPEEEEPLQGRFESIQRMEPEEEELQMKRSASPESPAQLEADAAPRGNNTGLPDHLKSGIESLSGVSMDNVKVHYNSSQPAQLNALAYAQGTDIHVASGQEQHLPHEAWHVVQQAQGRVKPTMQMKDGVPVNDDAGLEHEADVMGAKAADVGHLPVHSKQLQGRVEQDDASLQRKPIGNQGETKAVNSLSSGLLQRLAISATDKGKGKLKVETGGDFDKDHAASDWNDAVQKSARRPIKENTVFTDMTDLKAKVSSTDLPVMKPNSMTPCSVSGVKLWQIDTKLAAQGALGPEPAQVSKTVEFKTGMAAEDGNEKKPGAYTRDSAGPLFLVTGVKSVG